jgi:hypothetical protein
MTVIARCGFEDCKSHISGEIEIRDNSSDKHMLATSLGWLSLGGKVYCPKCVHRVATSFAGDMVTKLGGVPIKVENKG